MNPLFYIALFVAVWFGAVNVCKAIYRQSISPGNFIIMALAVVVCVYAAIEL